MFVMKVGLNFLKNVLVYLFIFFNFNKIVFFGLIFVFVKWWYVMILFKINGGKFG